MFSILAETVAGGPTHLTAVVVTNGIIWGGIVLYLVRLDLRLRRMEKGGRS